MSAKVSSALFGVVVVLLLVVGFVSARLTKALAESEQWVSHTHEVQSVIGRLGGKILAADNLRLRSLLFTPSPAPPDYASASRQVEADLQGLRDLTRDNPSQKPRLAELSQLIVHKFSILNRSSELLLSKRSPGDQNQLSLEGLQVSNRIAVVLGDMQSEEEALLRSRQQVSSVTYAQVRISLAAAFAAAVLILTFTFYQLMVELRDRKRAEDAVRRLSARLLQLQDSERRKVARELHDSIGQYFVSLKMNFEMLRGGADPATTERIMADCNQLLDQGIVEARTLSHLLHPPLLEEAGFLSAAKWYVDGFTERSKIQVKLDAPRDLPRLGKDIELALFRVLQESLTNIHRHSGSRSAEISIAAQNRHVKLTVRDFGKGIPASLLKQFEDTHTGTGIGLAGMRERMTELGGTMLLSSDGTEGTLVSVSAPLPETDAGRASGQTPQTQVSQSERAIRNDEDSPGLLLIDSFCG